MPACIHSFGGRLRKREIEILNDTKEFNLFCVFGTKIHETNFFMIIIPVIQMIIYNLSFVVRLI